MMPPPRFNQGCAMMTPSSELCYTPKRATTQMQATARSVRFGNGSRLRLPQWTIQAISDRCSVAGFGGFATRRALQCAGHRRRAGWEGEASGRPADRAVAMAGVR